MKLCKILSTKNPFNLVLERVEIKNNGLNILIDNIFE